MLHVRKLNNGGVLNVRNGLDCCRNSVNCIPIDGDSIMPTWLIFTLGIVVGLFVALVLLPAI